MAVQDANAGRWRLGIQIETAADDAVALAQEDYPVEAPKRRLARTLGGCRAANRGNFEVSRSARMDPTTLLFERIDSRLNEKIVIDQNMNSASREQYRRLAAVLHDAQSTAGCRW